MCELDSIRAMYDRMGSTKPRKDAFGVTLQTNAPTVVEHFAKKYVSRPTASKVWPQINRGGLNTRTGKTTAPTTGLRFRIVVASTSIAKSTLSRIASRESMDVGISAGAFGIESRR